MSTIESREDEAIKIGFSLGVGYDETAVGVFLRNIRYAEWLHRGRTGKLRISLADRLHALFEVLPREAKMLITDDEKSLVREIVRTRNVLIHALEETQARRATGERLETIVMKLGILLVLHLDRDYGRDHVMGAVRGIRQNRNVMKYLSQTDRVDNRQARLPGL